MSYVHSLSSNGKPLQCTPVASLFIRLNVLVQSLLSYRPVKCSLIASVGLLPFIMASVSADVIKDNFGPGDSFFNGGFILQGEAVGTIANVDQAASFTVGPSDYLFTSVALGLNATGINGGAGPVDFILAADNGGIPGTALETLTGIVPGGAQQVITRGASGTSLLQANTTYWIIADAKGTFDGDWGWNTQGDVSPSAGRSAPSLTENYGPWSRHNGADQFAFRVEGRSLSSTVPDGGSTFMLFGLAALALRVSRGGYQSLLN